MDNPFEVLPESLLFPKPEKARCVGKQLKKLQALTEELKFLAQVLEKNILREEEEFIFVRTRLEEKMKERMRLISAILQARSDLENTEAKLSVAVNRVNVFSCCCSSASSAEQLSLALYCLSLQVFCLSPLQTKNDKAIGSNRDHAFTDSMQFLQELEELAVCVNKGLANTTQDLQLHQMQLDAELEQIERANPIHQPELGTSDRRKELVEEKGKSIRERDHNRSWGELGHMREAEQGIKQTSVSGEEARKSKPGRENKPWDERLSNRRKELLDLSSTSVVTLDALVSKLDEIKQIDIEKQLDERLVAGKMLEKKLRQVAQETRDLEEILYSMDLELQIKKNQLKHNEQIVLQYLDHNPSTWDEQQMEDRIRNLSHLQKKIAIAQALKIMKQQKIERPGENNNMCMMCCDRPKNARLSPCGHALCNLCAAMINKCPNCRTQITERQPLYL